MKKQILTIIYLLFAGISILFSQEKKAGMIVTNYYTSLDAGNQETLESLLSEDFKATVPFFPTAMDKKNWLGTSQAFKTGFPDMKHQVLNWFADDNLVSVQGLFTGTNSGPMMGNPPTNNHVKLSFLVLMELSGRGQIKSLNVQFDNKTFESQLMTGIPDAKMMAEKTIRDLFVVMDAGETDKFVNYCSSNFTISNPFLSAPSPIGAFQGILQTQKTAFPDMKHQILEMTSDGKYVTTRGIFSGTNTGPMMGNPPTGNTVMIPFLVLDEFDSKGKLKMRNVQFDAKSFEAQLMAGINPNAIIEQNIRALYKAADDGDGDKFLSYWAEHGHPYFNGEESTLEEMKSRIVLFKKGFPDIKRSVEEVIVSGNKVSVRGLLTGTNTGSFMGKPATMNKVKITWLGLYHMKPDGKIKNGWVEFDSAALQNQLSKKTAKKK